MLLLTSLATPWSWMEAYQPGNESLMNIPLTPIRFLRYAQQQFAHKTAVVCGDQRLTYAEDFPGFTFTTFDGSRITI